MTTLTHAPFQPSDFLSRLDFYFHHQPENCSLCVPHFLSVFFTPPCWFWVDWLLLTGLLDLFVTCNYAALSYP